MAGAPSELHCNGCGTELLPGNSGVAATCYHIFCTACAQKLIENDEPCPLCESVIARRDVKLVTVQQPNHKVKLLLCGQTPEVIADVALTAINFYVEQQRLTGMLDNHNLKQKMGSMQAACRKKLMDMQQAVQQAKQKYVSIVQQKNALEQDNAELQQKYAQKASQTRKLTEMFKALQKEHEELKRHLRGSTTGGSGAGRSGLPAAPRAGGNNRQLSPFGNQHTQTVTTVQHTKAMFDLSPAPGSGMHMLTGHGSAVVGSGHNTTTQFSPSGQFGSMFGAGGAHGMPAGQRPSTAGGMFAASAMGNNRATMGSAGGMRVQGGMGNLGSPAGGMMSL